MSVKRQKSLLCVADFIERYLPRRAATTSGLLPRDLAWLDGVVYFDGNLLGALLAERDVEEAVDVEALGDWRHVLDDDLGQRLVDRPAQRRLVHLR